MKLYINIDTNTRFQFNGDVVIPDGDLFDPASHQRFIKFSELSSLLCDIILQVVDSLYLFIPFKITIPFFRVGASEFCI